MELSVYNTQGKEVKKAKLLEKVFGVKLNSDLLHQVVVSQMSNRRQGSAHTKTRGDVRGGGKKPWRQKGTGRARHGSIRSPLWKGGGVTFGPTNEKNYKKKITKQMRKKALFMAISSKVSDDNLCLIDSFDIKKPKTQEMNAILKNLFKKSQSILIVAPDVDKSIILSASNIPKVEVTQTKDLNALDVMSFNKILMPEKSLEVIEKTFLKSDK